MIAAIFVAKGGCYFGLDGVDPWDESRDARKYAGPHPVVAHPPCQRWGRYWAGGPSVRERKTLGDDNRCFWSALDAVRTWGGVLEHPEASHAWDRFGLLRPPKTGGWTTADRSGGWTCCVEQGHYGHRARKATWLYVSGVSFDRLPWLTWGPSRGERLDEGFHSQAERIAARSSGRAPVTRLSKQENTATPPTFRDLLISIAQSAQRKAA